MSNPFKSEVSFEVETVDEVGEYNQRFTDAFLDIRNQLKADISNIEPKFHSIAKLRLLTQFHGASNEEKLASDKMRLTEVKKSIREGVIRLEYLEIVRKTDIDYLGEYRPTNKGLALANISENIIRG